MLLPFLTPSQAQARLDNIEHEWCSRGKLSVPSGFIVEEAEFAAVGGTPITSDRLRHARDRVLKATSELSVDSVQERNEFDRQLAVALGSEFGDIPLSQTGNGRAWQYLALVVFPDLILRRYQPATSGALPRDRFSSERRNPLMTAFRRWHILGPVLDEPEFKLTEDDLVQIVDRSLSNDHRLARVIARKIGSLRTTSQSLGQTSVRQRVREGLKSIQFERRVTALETLSDDTLEQVIETAFTRQTAGMSIPAAPRSVSRVDPDLTSFAAWASSSGMDVRPALEYEIPGDEQLPSIREQLLDHATRGLDVELSTNIYHRLSALLDAWWQLRAEQRRLVLAVAMYFIFEEDAKSDFKPGGFEDDLALVEHAESLIFG